MKKITNQPGSSSIKAVLAAALLALAVFTPLAAQSPDLTATTSIPDSVLDQVAEPSQNAAQPAAKRYTIKRRRAVEPRRTYTQTRRAAPAAAVPAGRTTVKAVAQGAGVKITINSPSSLAVKANNGSTMVLMDVHGGRTVVPGSSKVNGVAIRWYMAARDDGHSPAIEAFSASAMKMEMSQPSPNTVLVWLWPSAGASANTVPAQSVAANKAAVNSMSTMRGGTSAPTAPSAQANMMRSAAIDAVRRANEPNVMVTAGGQAEMRSGSTGAPSAMLPASSRSSLQANDPAPSPQSPWQMLPAVVKGNATDIAKMIPFTALGAEDPMKFSGIARIRQLTVGVSYPKKLTGATLKFKISHSPALLEEISSMKVEVNHRTVAVLPLMRKDYMGRVYEIPIDPKLLGSFNSITFGLIGSYTLFCEDPNSPLIWSEVLDGKLVLDRQEVPGLYDLAELPAPFFSTSQNTSVNLNMMVGRQKGSVWAGSVVAGWFGVQSDYRPLNLKVSDSLSAGNVIAVMLESELPQVLAQYAVGNPSIQLIPNPMGGGAVLLVTGSSEEQLRVAAGALAFSSLPMSGSRVAVQEFTPPSKRNPYDAPRWIPSDRPVRFGDLIARDAMESVGLTADPIRLPFRLPPDLFLQQTKGVPINLSYRYTPGRNQTNNRLDVFVDNQLLQSYPLLSQWNDPEGAAQTIKPGYKEYEKQRTFYITEAYNKPAAAELQFRFAFDYTRENPCNDFPFFAFRGRIDPDSTIDLTNIPHYVRMPDLGLFVNNGYPYTKLADLSETVFSLPDNPSTAERTALMAVCARFGAITGMAPYRHVLINGAQTAPLGKDIIAIRDDNGAALPDTWRDALQLRAQGGGFRIRDNDLNDLFNDTDGQLNRQELGDLLASQDGQLSVMVSCERPDDKSRCLVAMLATGPDMLDRMVAAYMDPNLRTGIKRDTAVFGPEAVKTARLAKAFYVGNLPVADAVHLWLRNYPLVWISLTLLLILIGVMSFRRYRHLRQIVAQGGQQQAPGSTTP
ncbi:MAG: cellulose biosynthesis cyclic di-GMP-binding regulatory protein BcsB [Armatimonadota bacterium]